jgi:hypothetical protein
MGAKEFPVALESEREAVASFHSADGGGRSSLREDRR